jgi:exonuclease-1
MFVYMRILSGCDYCDGVPGVGVQTAHKLVRIHRKPSKIFKSLDAAGKLPLGSEESFWIAYRTSRHQ